ncbi:MAG: helix-turn-helix domain-containing protein [Acetivibrionales bacterium]|jgi:DNA-binding XRE family transcriptional regulator
MKLNRAKVELAMADKCMAINDIAETSGIPRQTITAAINGRRNPKPITAGKIAKALGVSVIEIIEEMEE